MVAYVWMKRSTIQFRLGLKLALQLLLKLDDHGVELIYNVPKKWLNHQWL